MGGLFPGRGVLGDLLLPQSLHVADGVALAPTKTPQVDLEDLRRQYCGGGWWPATEDRVLIDLEKIGTTRYRYRGAVIPSPWPTDEEDTTAA